jgi:hypothetical protein
MQAHVLFPPFLPPPPKHRVDFRTHHGLAGLTWFEAANSNAHAALVTQTWRRLTVDLFQGLLDAAGAAEKLPEYLTQACESQARPIGIAGNGATSKRCVAKFAGKNAFLSQVAARSKPENLCVGAIPMRG